MKSSAHSQLVLSLFHGVDLFGRGFEAQGFTVVRAAEKILGFDVEELHLPPNRFDGMIAGTPCQDFSKARRSAPTGNGLKMLYEFARLIKEAAPLWFLLENVPSVPTIHIENYFTQRIDFNTTECGLDQSRLRHFQFGCLESRTITVRRDCPSPSPSPCAMASEGSRKNRRSFTEFCKLQGLPGSFTLPAFTKREKYRAVGNGVAVAVAERFAEAIKNSFSADSHFEKSNLCACNCGRQITGKQKTASVGCRKRIELQRKGKIKELFF